MKEFALLSHVLPPSPSGQGIILYRLLQDVDPDTYYVISNKNYDSLSQQTLASRKLDAQYYSLTNEPAIYTHAQTTQTDKIFLKQRLKRFLQSTPIVPILKWLRRQSQQHTELIKSLFQIRTRSQQILKILEQNPTKILIACTADIGNIPAAYLASRKANIELVPYIFDDYRYQWPGITQIIVRLMGAFIFKRVNHIIVTNEVMAAEYKRRYGVDSIIIRNLCPIPAIETHNSKDDEIKIVYAGATYAHEDSLRNLAEAVQQLADRRIDFHIYTMTTEYQLERHGIHGERIKIHDYLPQNKIFHTLSQANILFLPLAFRSKTPQIIKTASPGKMAEYMALARPILVHAPADSFISTYFRKNDCGVVVDKNDVTMLTDALSGLINDRAFQAEISQKARQLAIQDFSLERVRHQFAEAIRDISLHPTK